MQEEEDNRHDDDKANMENTPSEVKSQELAKSKTEPQRFYNPVDKGWSWVILVCVFLMNMVVLGVQRAFAVMFVPIQIHFNVEASTVSIIPGIQGATFSIWGLMTMMVLMSLMPVRTIIRLGVLVGTVGLSLCFLAESVVFLYVSQALMCGMGLAMSYGPGFVLLGSYFHKRRAMAVAIANTGGSVGTLLIPLITSKFLQEYSVPGTYLLLGGIIAQGMVICSFFTPPSDYKPRQNPNRLDTDPDAARALLASGKDCENKPIMYERRESGVNDEVENDSDSPNFRTRAFSESHKTHLVTFSEDTDAMPHTAKQFPYRRQFSEGNRSEGRARTGSASHASSDLNLSLLFLSCETIHCPPSDLASIRSAQVDEVSQQELGELDSKPRNRVKQCLASCFDTALMKCPLLWLLLAFIFFGVYGMVMPFAFLPALAIEKGLSISEAAFLLTIVGSLDIVSRLVPGFVAQMKWLKPQTMVCLVSLVLGTVFQLTAVLNTWGSLLGLAVVLGLCAGVFVSMMQLITIEFVGLPRFPQAFGLVQLALGIAVSSGHPLLGYIRDVTGSYVIPFHVIGASVYITAILLLLEPLVRRLQGHPTS